MRSEEMELRAPLRNPYFIVYVCVQTGVRGLWQPGAWYLRLTAETGYGGRIICVN